MWGRTLKKVGEGAEGVVVWWYVLGKRRPLVGVCAAAAPLDTSKAQP